MSGTLEAAFCLRRPALQLDVSFSLTAPWTCLFGPSGSGKSTLLRALAGFERPHEGRIAIGGQILFDSRERIWTRPHRRPLRMAAQRSWLFKGSVRANVLYGVTPQQRTRAEPVFDRLELRALADSPALSLSGGEQQRVAIARAVAAALYGTQPASLLLLDEPFNGLDSARRDVLATGLRDWLAEMRLPVLSVTHDLAEVFLLKAQVLRLDHGRIIAQGTPQDVLAAERTRLLETLGS